jgi:hypothetical protein
MNIQQYQMQSGANRLTPTNGMPRPTGNRTLDQYKLGIFGKDFPIQRFIGGPGSQIPTAAAAPPQQPYQLHPFTMHSPGLLPPGGDPTQPLGMSARRRRPMGYRFPQRDMNGNLPGEWDYQMPDPTQQQPPMVPYSLRG